MSNQAKLRTRKRIADVSGGGFIMEDPDTFDLVSKIANNAMNCAMQIMPDASYIYMASDSVEPTQYITHHRVCGKVIVQKSSTR